MVRIFPSITVSVVRQVSNLRIDCKLAGTVTERDCNNVAPMCQLLLAQNHGVDLLLDISQLQHCSLLLLCKKLLVAAKHQDAFHHIAIFGGDSWQPVIAKLSQRWMIADVRHFHYRAEAISWLDSAS
ncbi:STAS/SEC14 domain-containing protein [Shewanella waksmanii]|uniref:STAS/SEC14 domain-containing protein n=1 Tax=Shewanella waksmanii TaxID=213783 RepID=UPI0037363DFA